MARHYGWLAAFGAIHTVFLFFGDIMLNYGLIAMSVILLIGRRGKPLLIVAGALWMLMTVGSVVGALFIPEKFLGEDLTEYMPEFSNYLFYLAINAGWLVFKTITIPLQPWQCCQSCRSGSSPRDGACTAMSSAFEAFCGLR